MVTPQTDDDELLALKTLLDKLCASPLPIQKPQISEVAEGALTHIRQYKKVVHLIERYAKHVADKRHRSAVICVIDSLCTKSKRAHKEKDVFTRRFALRILDTVTPLKELEGRSERALMDRIFNEWRKRGWFDVPPLASLGGGGGGSGGSSKRPSSTNSNTSTSHSHRHQPHTPPLPPPLASDSPAFEGGGAGGEDDRYDDDDAASGGLRSPPPSPPESSGGPPSTSPTAHSHTHSYGFQPIQTPAAAAAAGGTPPFSLPPVDPRSRIDPRKRPLPDGAESIHIHTHTLTAPQPTTIQEEPYEPRKHNRTTPFPALTDAAPPADPRARRPPPPPTSSSPSAPPPAAAATTTTTYNGGILAPAPPPSPPILPTHQRKPRFLAEEEDEEEEDEELNLGTALKRPTLSSTSTTASGLPDVVGGGAAAAIATSSSLRSPSPPSFPLASSLPPGKMSSKSSTHTHTPAPGRTGTTPLTPLSLSAPPFTAPITSTIDTDTDTHTQKQHKKAHTLLNTFIKGFREGGIPAWPEGSSSLLPTGTYTHTHTTFPPLSTSSFPPLSSIPPRPREGPSLSPCVCVGVVPGLYIAHERGVAAGGGGGGGGGVGVSVVVVDGDGNDGSPTRAKKKTEGNWGKRLSSRQGAGTQEEKNQVIEILLLAGADPTITSTYQKTPLDTLHRWLDLDNHAGNVLLALLERAQFMVLLANPRTTNDANHALAKAKEDAQCKVLASAPPCLRGRVQEQQQRQQDMQHLLPRLPRVELCRPPARARPGSEEEKKRHAVLQYVLGTEELGENGGMLADMFVELMDMMTPRWDPIRRTGGQWQG